MRSSPAPAQRSARSYWAAASRCAPERGRASRGERGVRLRRDRVRGAFGVVGEPGVVVAVARPEQGQDLAVQGRAAVRRQAVLDGAPGDLVPEPQLRAVRDEQPGVDELVDRLRRRRGDRVEQVEVDSGAEQGSDVEGAARRSGQHVDPAEHGLARDAGSGVPRSRSSSVRKKGLPPVRWCSSSGGQARPSASVRTAGRGQPRDGDPAGAALGRELREAPAQRVPRRDLVVAVGEQEQHRERRGCACPTKRSRSSVASSAQCTSSNTSTDGGVRRRLRRPAVPGRSPRGSSSLIGRRQEGAAELRGDVEQRAEGPRGEQAVAGAPGPARSRLEPLAAPREERTCRHRPRRRRAPAAPRRGGRRRRTRRGPRAEAGAQVEPRHQCARWAGLVHALMVGDGVSRPLPYPRFSPG